MKGKAAHTTMQRGPARRFAGRGPLPEQWVPERILHGHLAGAGVLAEVARSGDGLMLTGSGLPGGPLVCRLDRRGPCGTMLDEPLAQAACGLMAVHGRGRGRSAARLGVDYVTTATGVAVQRLRGHPERYHELNGTDPFAAPWAVEPMGPAVSDGAAPNAADGRGLRSAHFLALNRGKRLVEADLWNPAGRRALKDAVAEADAFVHNWPPGKAARLGLDHDDLAAVNPRLVSAHASGWGDARGANPPPAPTSWCRPTPGCPTTSPPSARHLPGR